MFGSGLAGDFQTLIGSAKGTIFRLNLTISGYNDISESSIVAKVNKDEGRLIRVPQEIHCKICTTSFSASLIRIDSEETVEAYEL